MLNKLIQWFEQNLQGSGDKNGEFTVKLSTAVMFYELIRADHDLQDSELSLLKSLLAEQFGLQDDELQELVNSASHNAEHAVDIVQYTRVINEQCSLEQKRQLIHNLWKLAYADQQLDGHEEYFIRKVSDLIYLNHSDFIREKLAVVPQ